MSSHTQEHHRHYNQIPAQPEREALISPPDALPPKPAKIMNQKAAVNIVGIS